MGMTLLPGIEIGRRVHAVREEVGVSLDELAASLGVAANDVRALEEGRMDPIPGDYVLIIARILQTDFRFFISEQLDADEQSIKKIYRALGTPTPRDMLAVRRFATFATAERQLLALLSRAKPLRLPRPAVRSQLMKDQGTEAATMERQRLKAGTAPIDDVFALVRDRGALLFRHALVDSNLSGLTIIHPRAGTAILVNYVDDLYRQFFSAAHEYGHALLDQDELDQSGCIASYLRRKADLVEVRANAFASELLLPRAAVEHHRRQVTGDARSAVQQLARKYHVNAKTVTIKMKEVGWLTEVEANDLADDKRLKVGRHEKIDPELGVGLTERQVERRQRALQNGLPFPYIEEIRSAMVSDHITWGKAADLLDMPIQEAREFFAEVGAAL